MSQHHLASTLTAHRSQLVSHWETMLNRIDDPDQREMLVYAVERVKPPFSTPYSVHGRVCAEVYAATRQKSQWTFDVSVVPTSTGTVVFDMPCTLVSAACALTGFQWGVRDKNVWLVPLTHAHIMGMKPHSSLCPMMSGFALVDGDTVVDDHTGDVASVKAIVMALWQRMRISACQLIGPGNGSGVVVTHQRR